MMALAYTRAGSGPALVLVHGYLGGAAMWEGQVAALSARHEVVCPDLAGFGESAALDAPSTIGGHAAAVLSLLDDLGIARFDLMGHSMGGMVAQEMVRLSPARVGKLVLYGTGPKGVLPGRFETIAETRARLLEEGIGPTARRIAETWFRKGDAAEGFALCEALGRKVSLRTALACLDAWEAWDGSAALADIRNETLVLWGSHDRSYNWSQAEALWTGIAGADLAVVPGAAHNVHLEKPDLFNAIVSDFLRETV